jgi:hypothetical protein
MTGATPDWQRLRAPAWGRADWASLTDRFGDDRFATSLLGVTQLPAPGLLVLLEATAVD